MSEKVKKLITNLLLAFVLISIGFSLGKHSVAGNGNTGLNSVNGAVIAASNGAAVTDEKFVKIFYMHATFRCVTCNSIENKAKLLVERDFSAAYATKKIVWEAVNFQENEILAKKFDVVASCIVVAVVKGDEILEFKRLDDVWPLLDKPAEFDAYIANAIKLALDKVNGEPQ